MLTAHLQALKHHFRSGDDYRDRADILVRVDQAQRLVQLCEECHVDRMVCFRAV